MSGFGGNKFWHDPRVKEGSCQKIFYGTYSRNSLGLNPRDSLGLGFPKDSLLTEFLERKSKRIILTNYG
jgi:hypothetical protein